MAGHGAGILTPVHFREALRRGDLIQPFDIVAERTLSIWLVHPGRRRNAPAIRAFRAWLLAAMRALGAPPDGVPDGGATGGPTGGGRGGGRSGQIFILLKTGSGM